MFKTIVLTLSIFSLMSCEGFSEKRVGRAEAQSSRQAQVDQGDIPKAKYGCARSGIKNHQGGK